MHFGVREHLTTILRHWGKILLVLAGAVFVTGSIAFLSSKVYVSHARILILSSSPAERASRPNASDAVGPTASPQEQVLTQVAIIQSPALAEELALKLGPQRVVDEMRWRWDWLREIPANIKDRVISVMYGWSPTAALLETVGIQDPRGAGGVGGEPVGAARDKILDAMHAEAIVKTDIFSVAFGAPSPEFAAEVLNGLIDLYVENVVDLRRPVDTAAIAEQEAARLERVLQNAEEELRAFTQEFDILSLERQKDLLLDRWSRTQEELSQARRTSGEITTKLAVLREQIAILPRSESISTTTRPNPVVDRLRERIVQLEAEAQRFVSGSVAAVRLQREIDTLSAQLEDEAQAVSGAQTTGTSSLFQQLTNTVAVETAELEAADVRIGFLEEDLKTISAELRRVDGHELQYRQLERAVEAKEEAYRYALQKREETAIQTQIDEPSLAQVVPVERGSVPEVAAAPRRGRLLALGIIAGTLAGLGLAYLLEFARKTVSTVREAELAVGLPVLAATERFGLISRKLKRTRLEVRRFAVWVLHQRRSDPSLKLLFCAAHRQSGQSSLVDELAQSLHQHGADVLTLRLELADRTEAKGYIDPVEEGVTPHRAEATTIRAPAWEIGRLVRALIAPDDGSTPASHEIILIDAPDIARFPEQGTIAELADLALPVIEADRTQLNEVRSLIDNLRVMGATVPGIALTKRRLTRSSWAFSWMALTQRKLMERNAT